MYYCKDMNYSFHQLHFADLQRYGSCHGGGYAKRLLKCFRRCQTSNGLCRYYYRSLFKIIKSLHHIELYGQCKIGPGLYLGHPYCITINADSIIGKNCNIHKGVTIGQENRGERKGSPTIGDSVWIGVNATIVGKITIGDDVLIAPNTFVNCDVPSHSIVLGNPCIIKPCDCATKEYINNKCELD